MPTIGAFKLLLSIFENKALTYYLGWKVTSLSIENQLLMYRMYQMPRPILIQATRNPKVQCGWPILAVFAPVISQGNSDVGKSLKGCCDCAFFSERFMRHTYYVILH